jgi:hypothetical protein
MTALLLLIPIGLYFVASSRLWCILRSLPSTNEDFILF